VPIRPPLATFHRDLTTARMTFAPSSPRPSAGKPVTTHQSTAKATCVQDNEVSCDSGYELAAMPLAIRQVTADRRQSQTNDADLQPPARVPSQHHRDDE